MIRIASLVALLVAGCGRVGFDAVADARGSGTDPADANLGIACRTSTVIRDDFTSAATCLPWGTPIISSGCAIAEQGGDLEITPDLQANSTAQCRTSPSIPIPTDAIYVQVTSVLAGPDAYTALESVGLDTSFGVQNDVIAISTLTSSTVFATMPYTPALRFWKLVPVPNGLDAYVSIDGMSWTLLGSRPVASYPPMADFELKAGTITVPSVSPGVARFAHLLVCD